MWSDQAPPMEAAGSGSNQEQATASAKKLWRVLRAVYLVVGKHQPKLAALGVHLHQLLSKRHHHRGLDDVRRPPSFLSCRSMDPAAAVVHPYPRASLSSLSCRAMDPAAAVYQYKYRPREVEFSCSSTPLHKRRRAQRRLRLQQHDRRPAPAAEYGSAAAVTRLFELLDVSEAAEATDEYDDRDVESATQWAPAVGPALRQVRITDSPFPAREEEEEGRGAVDCRADEFIMWFHEQLRMQQQQPRAAARTGVHRVWG